MQQYMQQEADQIFNNAYMSKQVTGSGGPGRQCFAAPAEDDVQVTLLTCSTTCNGRLMVDPTASVAAAPPSALFSRSVSS